MDSMSLTILMMYAFIQYFVDGNRKYTYKPRFVMSGTLIFSHNSQNMTYFVTKFGMR